MPDGIFPPTPPATPPSSEDLTLPGQPFPHHFCQICHKNYPTKAKLSEHIAYRHSEARPFKCPQCPKEFKSASNVKQHVRYAHERPRFTCPDCPTEAGTFFLNDHLLEYWLIPNYWIFFQNPKSFRKVVSAIIVFQFTEVSLNLVVPNVKRRLFKLAFYGNTYPQLTRQIGNILVLIVRLRLNEKIM